ncbi:hypothetical protein OYE22_14880 [Streptomyces sp. 71268]|uniref:hypothetical protein n=1 Tax=Streptomyces sp. 71268 TaxID=3002640 RepID=UPI0023F7382C|nr:hypothetical protein [Streptomyces sp. 71268]WEV26337.1 hypothetical protein OYE22_14880 [Streptomyces sp. 71268]
MSQRTDRSRRTSRSRHTGQARHTGQTRRASRAPGVRRTRRTSHIGRAHRVHDLVVFLAVLGTAVGLVLSGVAPESLAAIAVAVSGLYAAWRGSGDRPRPPEGR